MLRALTEYRSVKFVENSGRDKGSAAFAAESRASFHPSSFKVLGYVVSGSWMRGVEPILGPIRLQLFRRGQSGSVGAEVLAPPVPSTSKGRRIMPSRTIFFTGVRNAQELIVKQVEGRW